MAENDAILNLTIASPEGILFQGKVDSVKLPGTKSAFMVLPLHAPIISSLSKGIVTYETNQLQWILKEALCKLKAMTFQCALRYKKRT